MGSNGPSVLLALPMTLAFSAKASACGKAPWVAKRPQGISLATHCNTVSFKMLEDVARCLKQLTVWTTLSLDKAKVFPHLFPLVSSMFHSDFPG